MSILVILLSVVASLSINEIQCTPISEREIQQVLKLLQEYQNEESRQSKIPDVDDKSDEHSSSDDSDEGFRYGSLRNKEVLDLIQSTLHDNDKQNDHREQNYKQRGFGSNLPIHKVENNKDNHDQYTQSKHILSHLLSQIAGSDYHKITQKKLDKKALLSSTLLESVKLNDDEVSGNREDISDLSDYSKIYVILNPQAVQKSTNKNAINDMLSKILSSSSSNNVKNRKNKYYKGFAIKNGELSRRARRDSREMYGPRDSIEDDYKQKRSRIDRGVMGGGRTAIPYIRHRGDIYEKGDH